MSTGLFEVMSESVDAEEHSIEMHLPYIYKVTPIYIYMYMYMHIYVHIYSTSRTSTRYFGRMGDRIHFELQGYLAHKKQPPPLGPP